MTTVTIHKPSDEVDREVRRAIADPYTADIDKETRETLRHMGFVTGKVFIGTDPTTLRLIGYRPGQWLGRLTPAIDPDKMAKPVLVGTISGDRVRTQIRYRVDAFGTAVGAVVLACLGTVLLLAGVAVSFLKPMPMPSLGFFLLVFGGVCLIFVFLIWQVVDHAILDEEYLADWLSGLLASLEEG